MSKKFGKVITGIAAAAAIGAGVFYWFKKKDEITEDDFEEEDFEDDFELDDDLEETSKPREYVSLTPSAEKETEPETAVPADEADKTESVSEEEPVTEV